MLNRKPIFLNCFSRGGSNILWNFFLSHPEVCSPIRETLEIFRAGFWKGEQAGRKIAALSGQRKLFDQWHLQERKPIPAEAKELLDRVLYECKRQTFTDAEMKFKHEDSLYTEEEVAKSRLVAKNNNGLAFLADILAEMYPDATFIAMVRHPFALFESHKRRRIIPSLGKFSEFYNRIVDKMLHDQKRMPNYHIIRFESLMEDPLRSVQDLYAYAGLDVAALHKIRLKAKPHMRRDGRHGTEYAEGRHYWFALDRLDDMLEADINSLQSDRLSDSEKRRLSERTGDSLAKLGYR